VKRFLIIDEVVKERIGAILDYAEDNRFDPTDKSDGWMDRIPGNNANLQLVIPDGYRCVFSYTLGPSKSIYYRHLSISTPKDYPSPQSVLLIAGLFGFTGEPTDTIPIPRDWQIELRKPGHQLDDPCIIVAQERQIAEA